MMPLEILVVDDHVGSALLLARLLRNDGHRVTTASTVAEALACARVDLLISDIGLPDGSGCDLLRAMHERGTPPRLAVALTGFGDEALQAECRAAGFNHFLVKPVAFADLLAVIGAPEAFAPDVPQATGAHPQT